LQTIFEDVEAGSLTYLLVQHVPTITHSAEKKVFPTVPTAPQFSQPANLPEGLHTLPMFFSLFLLFI